MKKIILLLFTLIISISSYAATSVYTVKDIKNNKEYSMSIIYNNGKIESFNFNVTDKLHNKPLIISSQEFRQENTRISSFVIQKNSLVINSNYNDAEINTEYRKMVDFLKVKKAKNEPGTYNLSEK